MSISNACSTAIAVYVGRVAKSSAMRAHDVQCEMPRMGSTRAL